MTSGILDEPAALRRLDRSDMLGAVAALPAGLADGWARTRGLTLPAAHRAASSIAVLGMGGSAIAGDIVAGIFSDRLTRPLCVVRDYALPAFVGPETVLVGTGYRLDVPVRGIDVHAHMLGGQCRITAFAVHAAEQVPGEAVFGDCVR